jgi:hypothetical protein
LYELVLCMPVISISLAVFAIASVMLALSMRGAGMQPAMGTGWGWLQATQHGAS